LGKFEAGSQANGGSRRNSAKLMPKTAISCSQMTKAQQLLAGLLSLKQLKKSCLFTS
jgi:hypothetical protein